ncbi:MAG: glycosyltransferase family 4 protein [Chloroflexi bacterium]|nr:glycosyltransferase family 4 protein [Chloroflexota bacterium]
MPELMYIAPLPRPAARALQVAHTCEAIAALGVTVTLWTAGRGARDLYAHSGVADNFAMRYFPAVLFPLAVFFAALFSRAQAFYSRDALILLLLSLVKPRRALTYEAHGLAQGRFGKSVQRWTLRRVGTVFGVTPALRDELARLGAKRAFVAHNAVRRAHFENVPSRLEARRLLGWPQDAFIVAAFGADGAHALIAALALVWAQAGGFRAALALIGVDDDSALRAEWQKLGLEAEAFLTTGVVPPPDVPLCLSACDVLTLLLPRTEHSAYYASPLRLFEALAARRALIAADLPAWEDVLTHEEHALLVPAGATRTLADALTRLYNDPLLRQALADSAYEHVMARFTSEQRARAILKKVFARDKKS